MLYPHYTIYAPLPQATRVNICPPNGILLKIHPPIDKDSRAVV